MPFQNGVRDLLLVLFFLAAPFFAQRNLGETLSFVAPADRGGPLCLAFSCGRLSQSSLRFYCEIASAGRCIPAERGVICQSLPRSFPQR